MWISDDGFADALNGLWRSLPTALKQRLTFRYCCTPRDGRSKSASVICTPAECRPRWKGHLCIQPPYDDTPTTQVEKLVTDEPTRSLVLRWAEELGAEIDSFEKLTLMADTQILYQQLGSASDLDVTVLFRNLARLAPNPQIGTRIKAAVLQELRTRIVNGPLDVIAYLRNLSATEFDGGAEVLRDATNSRLANSTASNLGQMLELTQQAITDNKRPWAVGLLDSFRDSLRKKTRPALRLFWKLMTSHEGNIRTWLVQASTLHVDLESLVYDMLPASITKEDGQAAVLLCKRTKWAATSCARCFCLHGRERCD